MYLASFLPSVADIPQPISLNASCEEACCSAIFPCLRRNSMSSSVTIDGLTAPAAASLEVANACGSFHSVQHGDSLHRANEPWVMQQDRGKVIAAQKGATCVVCRHKPPPCQCSSAAFHPVAMAHMQSAPAMPISLCR